MKSIVIIYGNISRFSLLPIGEGTGEKNFFQCQLEEAWNFPFVDSVVVVSPGEKPQGYKSAGKEQFSHTLHRIAVSEMTHLDILGSLLCKLGALPVFTSCPPHKFDFYTAAAVSYSDEPEKMLLCDIRGENEAIRGYEKMLCRLKNEQIRAVIARIIEDEKLHLQALEAMLAELRAGK